MNTSVTEQAKITYVYEQLEDEESKYIFKTRKLFYEDGDWRHINDMVDKYVPEFKGCGYYAGKEEELYKLIIAEKRKTVIYGAGIRGRKLVQALKKKGFSIDFYIDGNKKKAGMFVEGTEIKSFDYFISLGNKQDYLVIVSPILEAKDIADKLMNAGIKESNIVLQNCYMDAYTDRQYFDESIIKFADNEVFVDGGCCSFDVGKRFVKLLNKHGATLGKIYAFEPDSGNMAKCVENAEAINVDKKKIEFIEAGLWSRETELSFESNGNGTSRIVENKSGSGVVKVKSIDDVVKEKVTFIKMDIEGAELEALHGAKETIIKDRPKLAICVYHKKEDIWEIPYYIKKLVPEYKIYMRHYGNYIYETVMYAVCD